MNSIAAAESKIARYVDSLQDRVGEQADPGIVYASISDPHPTRPVEESDTTLFGLIELLLKDQQRLDSIARQPNVQRELVPRLMAIGLVGYLVFGVSLSIIFSAAGVWPQLTSVAKWLEHGQTPLIQFVPLGRDVWYVWLDGSAFYLVAAFSLGLLGANGICLPSFYFYNLLAGVRTTMLQVTVNALKGMAAGAVAVVGALPIYFAAVLGLLVFPAPAALVAAVCVVGLLLPFIAGFYGTYSLYRGFVALADTIPRANRCERACFLRRLVLAWSACFTAVTPLMIFTLWEYFQRS